MVGLALVGAVAQREEGVGVGLAGAPAHAPHHQLAGAAGLQLLGPLGHLELDAQAQCVHVLLPQLAQLARGLVGRGRIFQLQRLAIGRLAPAVAVAVDVAVQVEQRLGARQVVFAHLALEGAVVAPGAGRDRRLRRHRLAAPHQRDLALHVHRQRDGAAQRHLVRRGAADERMLHAEVGDRHVGARHALHADAALGQVGRELVVGNGDVRKLGRQAFEQILLAVQEGQPARLRFLDDRDLHLVDHRQAAALELLCDGLQPLVTGGRLLVVQQFAVVGVLRKQDARTALPLRQSEGPRAHRVLADLVAVGFDHLARQRAGEGAVGEVVQEARARFGEHDAQGVAVQRAQALDLGVVVEGLLGVDGLLAQLAQAQDLGVFQQVEVAALPARVVVALDRIDVVGGASARASCRRRPGRRRSGCPAGCAG